MKFKTISALILFAAMQAISHAVPAAQVTAVGAVTGDPTGLVGKTVTPPALPKGSDVDNQAYGNGYYSCGGAVVGDNNSDIGISILRKGLKNTCPSSSGKKTVTLTRHSNGNKTLEFLDAMEITVSKGYTLTVSDCKGASLAVAKFQEDSRRGTKHPQAWNIVNFKFVPVTNLKAVSCENLSYGV